MALFGVDFVSVRLGKESALYGQLSDASVFSIHQIQGGSHLFRTHLAALDQILPEKLDAHFGFHLRLSPLALLGEQGS
jgi:hypothetical protein